MWRFWVLLISVFVRPITMFLSHFIIYCRNCYTWVLYYPTTDKMKSLKSFWVVVQSCTIQNVRYLYFLGSFDEIINFSHLEFLSYTSIAYSEWIFKRHASTPVKATFQLIAAAVEKSSCPTAAVVSGLRQVSSNCCWRHDHVAIVVTTDRPTLLSPAQRFKWRCLFQRQVSCAHLSV